MKTTFYLMVIAALLFSGCHKNQDLSNPDEGVQSASDNIQVNTQRSGSSVQNLATDIANMHDEILTELRKNDYSSYKTDGEISTTEAQAMVDDAMDALEDLGYDLTGKRSCISNHVVGILAGDIPQNSTEAVTRLSAMVDDQSSLHSSNLNGDLVAALSQNSSATAFNNNLQGMTFQSSQYTGTHDALLFYTIQKTAGNSIEFWNEGEYGMDWWKIGGDAYGAGLGALVGASLGCGVGGFAGAVLGATMSEAWSS